MTPIETAYIDLLKYTLTDYHRVNLDEFRPFHTASSRLPAKMVRLLDQWLSKKGLRICRRMRSTKENRMIGNDWPAYADTMVGIKRLNNVQQCVIDVVRNNVPGDLIETGVW